MGRFITPDPYGGSANPANPQSWNRYSYVNNDPINKNDPSGLAPGDIRVDVVGRLPDSDSQRDPYLVSFLLRGIGSHGARILDRSDRADIEDARRVFKDEARDAVAEAKEALKKSECAWLFTSDDPKEKTLNPAEVLQGLFDKGKIEMGPNTKKWTAATSNTPGLHMKFSMYSGASGLGYWNTSDNTVRAETLLHELGHVFGYLHAGTRLISDTNLLGQTDMEKEKYNEKMVWEKCFNRPVNY